MSLPGPQPAARADAILARLESLHPRKIDLSLGRIQTLLERLGHPEQRLPPVAHVAGTNGKGSTIAFMRAIAEAAGLRTHVYTSPHLVSFRERFRLAGRLVNEERLADALAVCEKALNGDPITIFEATTAAGFYLFAETPADLLLLEVGLGGRFDATNVVDRPAVSVITPISYDHQEFLGSTLAQIAGEKAGVIKAGVPVVVARQEPEAMRAIERESILQRAPILLQGRDFFAHEENGRIVYEDGAGLLDLPLPRLLGRHQIDNAAVAVAAMRVVAPDLASASFERGVTKVEWPARMQRLSRGPLIDLAPAGAELWLDGGHNEAGGRVAAAAMADLEERAPKPLILICGMLMTKDPEAFLASFRDLAQEALAVAVKSENARPAMELAKAARRAGLAAAACGGVSQALRFLAARNWERPPRILIAGSLYLAGEVLAQNGVELT